MRSPRTRGGETPRRAVDLGPQGPAPTRTRFRDLDPYRIEREWKRYEGTAQRDLFRQLRARFLLRHATKSGYAVEIGPGPGRFTPYVGRRGAQRVALDISKGMLVALRGRWDVSSQGAPPSLVQADAIRPPLRSGSVLEVAALGNPIGFAGPDAAALLDQALQLLAPAGRIVIETVAGPGETSSYLARLPPRAVARLFRSPVRLVRSRIQREGFALEADQDPSRHGFRRVTLDEVRQRFRLAGVELAEAMAVAPALGFEAERAEAVAADPEAWAHLLAVEEELGRQPYRCAVAAALLVAGVRAA